MAELNDLKTNGRALADADVWCRQRKETPLEPDLPIIDAHHHLWDDKRGRYLLPELAKDIDSGHKIVGSVFVEAGGANMYRSDGPPALRSVGEVEFANGNAAVSASDRFGKMRLCAAIVGFADLMQGDRVAQVLEALVTAGNGRFRGIRQSVTWDTGGAARNPLPRHMMLASAFREGFARLEPLGLSFDAWLFYSQLDDLIDLLHAFPKTSVILGHCGGILGVPPHDRDRDEVFKIWHKHVRELSRFPNLTVKLGGLGMLRCGWDFHMHDVPPSSEELSRTWRRYIEALVELFGPGRCMMESNFPPDKQSTGYGVLWNAMKRITKDFTAAEKAAVYHDTAARIYRLTI